MKSPKPRNKALRKVDYKNYDAITMSRNYYRKLWGEIITGNYEEKLLQEIMMRNYHRKLSADAENVGITVILAYPKIIKKGLCVDECATKNSTKILWQFFCEI